MKRRHRTFIAIGLAVFLAGWLAWSVLLTESEIEQPPVAEQPR
jgi:hypothetical protein